MLKYWLKIALANLCLILPLVFLIEYLTYNSLGSHIGLTFFTFLEENKVVILFYTIGFLVFSLLGWWAMLEFNKAMTVWRTLGIYTALGALFSIFITVAFTTVPHFINRYSQEIFNVIGHGKDFWSYVWSDFLYDLNNFWILLVVAVIFSILFGLISKVFVKRIRP